jgi:hypothetical protein
MGNKGSGHKAEKLHEEGMVVAFSKSENEKDTFLGIGLKVEQL